MTREDLVFSKYMWFQRYELISMELISPFDTQSEIKENNNGN